MKLSLRNKVLGAFGVIVLLVTAFIGFGFLEFRKLGTQLQLLEEVYLPWIKTVNRFSNAYHLGDQLTWERLKRRDQNKLFLDTVTRLQPDFFNSALTQQIADLQTWQSKNRDPENINLNRLQMLGQALLNNHKTYQKILIASSKQGSSKDLAQLKAFETRKGIVIGQLNLLSRRLDGYVRFGIRQARSAEQTTMVLAYSFSAAIALLCFIILWVLLNALRPLKTLQAHARRIQEGEFGQEIVIRGDIELAELGESFHQMSMSLQERETKLNLQKKQLLESERLSIVGKMVSKISHEIRNPLNAINLNLETLYDDEEQNEKRQTLQLLLEQVDRLESVIARYLGVSQRKSAILEEVNIQKSLEDCVALFERELEDLSIQVTLPAHSHALMAKADVILLYQALSNVFKNAIDAMSDTQIEKRKLVIETDANATQITIDIRDQGQGMPEDFIEEAFEPMVSRKPQGTGLGLSITKEVMDLMHGEVFLTSKEGQGTKVTLTLPRA